MMSENLLKELSELGFPLFKREEKSRADSVLARLAKSGDSRLWEGFPVVLANSVEKGLLNYENVLRQLKRASDKSKLNALLAMSLALYEVLGLKFSWTKKLLNSLSPGKRKILMILKRI